MKTIILLIMSAALSFFAFTNHKASACANAPAEEPWTQAQLMDPSVLAAIISDPKSNKPLIYNMGPAGRIKGSIEIGPGREKENMNKLKTHLSKLSKDSEIVIYCGCCPFADCPNIRPPFELLNKMGFKNHKLLNLSRNLKVDWIDKGYPMHS